jgi:hypothetical protein
MTLQTLAAFAVVVQLGVIASACAAGFLLARGTRLPGWTAAVAMLLITRAINMTAAYAWATPSASERFPIVDVTVGFLVLAALTYEVLRGRRERAIAARATDAPATPSPVELPEAHADAA